MSPIDAKFAYLCDGWEALFIICGSFLQQQGHSERGGAKATGNSNYPDRKRSAWVGGLGMTFLFEESSGEVLGDDWSPQAKCLAFCEK